MLKTVSNAQEAPVCSPPAAQVSAMRATCGPLTVGLARSSCVPSTPTISLRGLANPPGGRWRRPEGPGWPRDGAVGRPRRPPAAGRPAHAAPLASPTPALSASPLPQGMPGPAPSAKPVLVPAPSNDPSTTSTWTQQQQQQQPGVPPPCDGLAGGAGPPLGQQQQQAGGGSGGGLLMRQVSLDAITAADFCPAAAPAPDRSSIFNDVIEQLAAKEESLPAAAGLYTLPSIQFLESLLEDMDSKTASDGRNPVDPPLYLPLDAFDLPFEEPAKLPVRPLAPSPFDMAPAAGAPHPPPPPQQLQPTYHVHAAATLRQPIAPPHPHHHHHSGLIPTSNSMPVLGQPPLGYHGGCAGGRAARGQRGGPPSLLLHAAIALLVGPVLRPLYSASAHRPRAPPAPRLCPQALRSSRSAGRRAPRPASPCGAPPLPMAPLSTRTPAR